MPQPSSPQPSEQPPKQPPSDPLPESSAWNITATMMSGLLGFGLPAYLLARWSGWEWLTAVGLLAGMGLALTIVWFRYGTYRP